MIDEKYVRERTVGFRSGEGRRGLLLAGTRGAHNGGPGTADSASGANPRQRARSAMVLTARGAEQQAQGVNNTLSYINIALALGLVGRPFSGYGCLTGQGNGTGRTGARPEV